MTIFNRYDVEDDIKKNEEEDWKPVVDWKNARLIDANVLKDFYQNAFDFDDFDIHFSKRDIISNLNNIPSISVEDLLIKFLLDLEKDFIKETIKEYFTESVHLTSAESDKIKLYTTEGECYWEEKKGR